MPAIGIKQIFRILIDFFSLLSSDFSHRKIIGSYLNKARFMHLAKGNIVFTCECRCQAGEENNGCLHFSVRTDVKLMENL